MCLTAAEELAQCAAEKGLRDDYILPRMDEWDVAPREAAAVGMKAIEQGITRQRMTRSELFTVASDTIRRAQEETRVLMASGVIVATQ